MSLRLRLLLAVGTVAVIALAAADLATYSSLRAFLYQRVDQTLDAAHGPYENALEGRGGGVPVGEIAGTPGMFVEAVASDGTVLRARNSPSPPGATPATPRLPSHFDLPTTSTGPEEPASYVTVRGVERKAPSFRLRASTTSSGYLLIIGAPLGDTTATLDRLAFIELAVTLAALGAAVALGWWLVRLGLRPLVDVERTAVAIADGQLDQRVPGAGPTTEVGRLAASLNVMLSRIEEAFAARDTTLDELRRSEEQLRRFVADASHELRTPLAAVAAYAELFGRGARERPEDLERVMSGILVETARMRELVEDLLLLARLDEGRPLEQAPVELVELVGEAVQAARAVGPDWPVEIVATVPVEVIGDRTRIRQVIDNLLGNVRSHTPTGTRTTVRVGVDGSDAVMTVADHGPGLDPNAADRVFERFYRADSSRTRRHDPEAAGGAGLGLAIVAAIVAAHGGTVTVTSEPGAGASFAVRIPMAAPAPGDRSDGPRGRAGADEAGRAVPGETQVSL